MSAEAYDRVVRAWLFPLCVIAMWGPACAGPEGPPGEEGQRGAQGLQGIPGPAGPAGQVPAAISAVQPLSVFAGRVVSVLISGTGTQFDQTTVVDFGADIDVDSVVVASPAALSVSLFVRPTAALGPRDILVQTGEDDPLTFAGAFTLAAPVSLLADPPEVPQGSHVDVTVVMHDPDTPFSALSPPTVGLGAGSLGEVLAVSAQTVDVRLYADVLAATGPVALSLSAPLGDGTSESLLPEAVTIAPRVPTELTAGVPVSATLPADGGNHVYALSAPVGTAVHAALPAGTGASVRLLDDSGRFDTATPAGLTASRPTPDTGTVYAVVEDTTGLGGPAYTLNTAALNLVAEQEPNNDLGSAQVITGPALLTGAIDAAGDGDFFSLNHAGGALTVSTLATDDEACGPDGPIDTYIELLDEQGTPIATNEDAGGNWCSSVMFPSLEAGTYVVWVVASPTYCPACAFGYRLSVISE